MSGASRSAAEQSLWSVVREAIRGSTQDLTRIPIGRAVLFLAVPMVLEMSMESLFAVVDIFFVSRLGSRAVASVGLTESMLAIVYALAMGLSAGATAIIARRVGEKDEEAAANAAAQVVFAAVGCASLLGVLGVVLAPSLLAVMGATPDVVSAGSRYTAIMLGGSVTIFLLFVLNGIFRASGDAAAAMRTLWLANGLNIVLAPIFIFGLHMGVAGAAIATTIGRGIGVAYQAFVLVRRSDRFTLARRHLVLLPAVLRELLAISGAATFQSLVETASWLGLVRILSSFGSDVLAGYTITMRVAMFALLPAFGLSNAAATLVGQNLGAQEPERAATAVKTVAKYNVAFLGSIGLVFVIAPRAIISIFTRDPTIDLYATEALRILALGFVAFAYGMVMVMAFNGAGDTTTPLVVNFVVFWFAKIPLAYVLARVVGMGPRGVFWAITLAYSLQALVATILFRRGTWKTKQV